MNLTLTEAFGRFGAKPSGRLGSSSAMAADGAMVLACASGSFRRPTAGVLRYEDRLSGENDGRDTELLMKHLTLVRDGALPIRMVVATQTTPATARPVRTFDVRPDLTGKLVEFDADHFIIDFTRAEGVASASPGKRK